MKEIQLAFQQTTLYSRDQIVNRKNLNLIRNEAPPRKIDKCQLWKEVSDEFANTIKVKFFRKFFSKIFLGIFSEIIFSIFGTNLFFFNFLKIWIVFCWVKILTKNTRKLQVEHF